MEYKGYIGQVEFDDEANIFSGEVINTRDVITFSAESVDGLWEEFRRSVDDYLAFCEERGEAPEKPFSGQFVTRVEPALHSKISAAAARSGMSLNAWVVAQLERGVSEVPGKAAKIKTRKAPAGRRQTQTVSKSKPPSPAARK